jgi:hypothetical protein
MRCIFCKLETSASKSVEHIIPESLWNTQHVLPRGVVCDNCNNYFSLKVEKPFLSSPAVTHLRFHEAIPSKRGKIPTIAGVVLPDIPVQLHRHIEDPVKITINVPEDAYDQVVASCSGTLIFKTGDIPPADAIISRFLAKMAIEALAHRVIGVHGGQDFIVDEVQFDTLRQHARNGIPFKWPHHSRRIYDADIERVCPHEKEYQTVHEFDFLYTETGELYFVFALFGLELVINVGGPQIDGYVKWLETHSGASPLYYGKNATEEETTNNNAAPIR